MKRKVGDTVRIRSREWMEAQEKDRGCIISQLEGFHYVLNAYMRSFAGEQAKVVSVCGDHYELDIDSLEYDWEDWMFEPDEALGKELSAEEAILAMLDGEILERGYKVLEKFDGAHFVYQVMGEDKWTLKPIDGGFAGLRRRPVERKQLMTRWEILGWASSEESRGWVVSSDERHTWYAPQFFSYDSDSESYCRARLLPDLSGVDESSIQGFEVEG